MPPLSAPAPDCPEEMTLIVRPQGRYCIDRWEASIAMLERDGTRKPWPPNRTVDGLEDRIVAESAPGSKPQGYISGVQAARACEHAHKRLCEIDEWVRACRGPKLTLYPYGNQRQPKTCNDRYKTIDRHPVVRLFKQYAPPGSNPDEMWNPKWMNDPRLFEFDHTVAPSGAFAGCTNEHGVYDMVGNLHEWVADPDGTFFGGFFLDTYQNGEGCEYRTIFHPFDYHDYSTGFRCCRDAEEAGTDGAH
jgi:formylglycine-generating enzyme required for sulfatase activity